jgi:3-deoxy-manno-octulosonate cytidylyltransferase (CMP-KDO synthetase)
VVATDDTRIYEHVRGFGGDVVMTSIDCPTGTDRLVEALQNQRDLDGAHIIVNIQGDEPCVDREVIQKIVELLQSDPQAVMATAAVKFHSAEDAQSRSVVKCVMDNQSNALYFSRSLLAAGHTEEWKAGLPVFRHMGIYAYRRDFLLQYAQLPRTPLQIAEDLEQLKVLEHGFRIKIAVVDHYSIGVDIPTDIQKVEQLLWKQSISS